MDNEKYYITQSFDYENDKDGKLHYVFPETKEVTKEEYEKWTGGSKHMMIDGKLYSPEQKEYWENRQKEFEKTIPGYIEFLTKLQVGKKIKFNGLKFRNEKSPPNFKQDVIIEIVFREEIGFMGRCPGCGCIEYAKFKDDGSLSDCHSGGYFPCQTFTSMRGWYRASDSYEVLN